MDEQNVNQPSVSPGIIERKETPIPVKIVSLIFAGYALVVLFSIFSDFSLDIFTAENLWDSFGVVPFYDIQAVLLAIKVLEIYLFLKTAHGLWMGKAWSRKVAIFLILWFRGIPILNSMEYLNQAALIELGVTMLFAVYIWFSGSIREHAPESKI